MGDETDHVGREVFLELEIEGEAALFVNGELKRGINEGQMLLDREARQHYELKIRKAARTLSTTVEL